VTNSDIGEVVDPPKQLERNMRGLVECLFDELDRMRDGTGSAERVRTVCLVAASVASLAHVEIKLRLTAEKTAGNLERLEGFMG
jgi:hypothetical protein